MEEISSSSPATHVPVLAFPFGTHVTPLFTLTTCIAAAAPDTLFSFFTTSQSKNMLTSNQKHIPQNVKLYDVSDGVPQDYKFFGNYEEVIEFFMKTAQDSFTNGIKAAIEESEKEVTCMVSDGFLWFSADIAREMGVPWLPFWAGGIDTLSAHLYTDLIRKTIGMNGFVGHEDQTLEFIAGLSKIPLRDLPEGIVFGNLESFFSRMLHQMSVTLPKAAAVLVNSFRDFSPTSEDDLRSKFNKFLSIGPFNLLSPPETPGLDSTGCIAWLDTHKTSSVAYISFGSFTVPPSHELVGIAEALETSGVPFIWSLKDNSKVHLPGGFLARTEKQGMVVPWAPQVHVLEHAAVGVFITHCGWNSLLEAIASQVPMICRPFLGDQLMNARMVEDLWEIGVRVEDVGFTKTGIMRCLDLLYNDDKGKRSREKAKALKELAEKAIGPDGSSTINFKELVEIVTGQQ